MNRWQSRRGSVLGGVGLMLFMLPFAGVGVFMTGWLWREVLTSREILAKWVAAPAVIESAQLKSQRGSKGGQTYLATGSFSYVYEGRTYRSERVGLSDGYDNVGNYHHALHRELEDARREKRMLVCRVNPENPTEAILRPEWRPEMALFKALFGVAFGGAGLGMFVGGVLSFGRESRKSGLKKRHPNEPWRWREEWQTPVLRAQLGRGMVVATVALLWINVTTWPLWSAVRPSWAAEGAFKWVLSGALLLVVVGSAFCARVIIHARKYRGARLAFDALPLRPGTAVVARLYLPQALPIGAVLKLALTSEHRVTVGSGKHRRTNTTTLWTHEQEENGPLAPGQEVVLRCRLPDDAHPTTLENPADVHAWVFTAKAEVHGVDLKLTFEVPVVRVEGAA